MLKNYSKIFQFAKHYDLPLRIVLEFPRKRVNDNTSPIKG